MKRSFKKLLEKLCQPGQIGKLVQLSRYTLWMILLGLLPFWGQAADGGVGIDQRAEGLNGVLNKLYEQMIPMAGHLIGAGQAMAGFAALWYIAVRVWRHIARAEPIDFYPLLRPFALGLAILFFLPLVHLINGVLQPTVTATGALAGDSQRAIFQHIEQQERAVNQPPVVGFSPADGHTDQYEQPDGVGSDSDTNLSTGLESAFSFLNIKSVIKTAVTSLVNLLYEAAALCINTIRTFYLIIMVILGPIVLGLSVFDGFKHSLSNWFARYINIYMWLPVANIFGGISSKILENMMTMDQDFFSSTAYTIFMLISVVGYMTVPSVANFIVHAGGGGRGDGLLHKVNSVIRQAGKAMGG